MGSICRRFVSRRAREGAPGEHGGAFCRLLRTDRMATVCDPGSGRIHPSFASVAGYYGVGVDVCPARRANRKGAVESRNHFITQRWWRSASVTDMADGQTKLDQFLATTGDGRRRGGVSVGQAARAERLIGLPAAPYPATVSVTRRVGASALISYQATAIRFPRALRVPRSVCAIASASRNWRSSPRVGPSSPATAWAPPARGRSCADAHRAGVGGGGAVCLHHRAALQGKGQPPAG